MNIVIDSSWLYTLGSQHPFLITLHLIRMFGWIPILLVICWGIWQMWMNFIQDQFVGKIKFILLAIDVPKNNLQTPKAVEQMFAHLAGAHATPNLIEEYWDGYVQPWFSLEIVSIDGYVQFFIWTPDVFRDLVEAAIYAQYHDAEITEVEDYADKVPLKYPDKEWNVWGTELILARPDCYPIKTYTEFEHSVSEDIFKDPMAALLEMMSRLQPGEQAWIQILIRPIRQDWIKKCDDEVKKLIKQAVEPIKTWVDGTMGGFLGALHSVADAVGQLIVPESGAAASEKEKKEQYNIVQNLTEGEKEVLSGIQKKAAKIGYKTKMRQVYIARKEVFLKQRGVSGIFGAIKQFNSNDRNSIKPELDRVVTRVDYFFKNWRVPIRQTKLMTAYKERSFSRGTAKFAVLNIEELATLWHFPMVQVKAPLIKKAEVRKAGPPSNLPQRENLPRSQERINLEHEIKIPEIDIAQEKDIASQKQGEPPENLPFE